MDTQLPQDLTGGRHTNMSDSFEIVLSEASVVSHLSLLKSQVGYFTRFKLATRYLHLSEINMLTDLLSNLYTQQWNQMWRNSSTRSDSAQLQ